ncbi:O-antigen ligase family protein [Patescibacteria group bacterium]|nr:O-antigen ligase family protein [Patescibacteria group bacterium]
MQRWWNALGPTTGERIVRLLLLGIIFAIPFGAVILLSESRAVVAGTYNPFAVPKIYVLEPIIIITALLWTWYRPAVGRRLHPYRPLLGVLALAAISFIWSPYPALAAASFGHLFVAFLLLYMLADEFRDQKFLLTAVWTLTASAAVQALWAIGQFGVNHDFGAQLIGESNFSPTMLGVAKVPIDGLNHIRGYGTLPHPNLLAALLSAAIFWVGTVIFWPNKKRPIVSTVLLGLLLGLLATGLVVTFSRIGLLLVLVNGLLVVLFSVRKWQRLPLGAAIGAGIFFIAVALLWQPLSGRATLESSQETGVTNRAVSYDLASNAIQNRPLGVGVGNFVVAIDELETGLPDYQHQPAHNALLLATSEAGILGGVLLIWFVVRTGWLFHRLRVRDRLQSAINFSLFVLAGTFIGLSLFDHFFWSLPQGLWLTVLVTAAVISRIPRKQWEDSPSARP